MATIGKQEASKKVIDETIRLYSDLLSRPPVERQLVRPSFRYIQDLVKALITETRILRDVFNPVDFDLVKRTWDKRMKTDFVQKLIDFSAKNSEPVVGCVAAKIVAGLEPNKTNELLQALARLARARLSGQEATNGRPRTFTRQSAAIGGVQAKHQPSATISRKSNVQTKLLVDPHKAPLGTSSARSSRSGSNASVSPDKVRKPANQLPDVKVDKDGNGTKSTIAVEVLKQFETKPIEAPEKRNDNTVLLVTSESDISKHIPQLRLNLKQLRKTLKNVSQLEESLRDDFGKMRNRAVS